MSSTIQIAFKLGSADLTAIDEAVQAGRFESRAAALRDAVRTWLEFRRREEIDRQLEVGYRDVPPSRLEEDLGEVSIDALSDADLDW